MNARLQMKLVKPAPTPGVERIPRKPVALTPIPWGTRDYATACAVLQNMVETTPGIHIRWAPNHSRVERLLRSQRVAIE